MSKPNAKNTLLISDMTGTILFQQEDGFPQESQEKLVEFLNLGGTFVLVTGDSLETAKKCFLDPLLNKGFSKDASLYLITANGYQNTEVSPCEKIHYQSSSLPLDYKKKALSRFEFLLSEFFETSFLLSDKEKDVLLSEKGLQLFVQDRIPNLNESLGIESIPNKVTLCFFNQEGDCEQRKKLIDCFVNDSELQALAKKAGLHTIVGNEFIDYINCTKGDGIQKFFDLQLVELKDKTAFVVGDSPNDRWLFEFDYPVPHQNIYVGPDESYFNEVVNTKKKGVHFKEEHTQGFYKVLNEMITL